MRKAARIGMSILLGAIAPQLLSGCIGVEKLSDATLASYHLQTLDPGACASGADTFRTAVFPYLETNCAVCHSAQSPAFATGDAATSYPLTKALVNFSAITSSRIYIRSIDGHCGIAGCQKSGTEIGAAIKLWGDAESKVCANPGGTTGGIANQGVLPRVNSVIQQAVLSAAQQAGVCVPYEVAFVKDGIAQLAPTALKVSLSGATFYSDSTCKVVTSAVSIASGQRYQNFYVMETTAGDRTILGAITGYAVGFTIQLSVTAAPAPTPSPIVTPTPSPKPSPSPTPTATPTPSPKPSPSPTPTATPAPSPKPSPSPTPTATPTPSPTPCSTTQKMNAYGATVWPLAKVRCATCHTASAGLPQFGQATLANAYPIARGLVAPAFAIDSKMYIKSKDGHCGAACSAATGADFLTQMQLWFPAELSTNCSALTTPH